MIDIDPRLLDELARCYMRAALARLITEHESVHESEPVGPTDAPPTREAA